MKIGEIIQKYCFDQRISAREFARRSGVTSGYISFLVNEKNPRTGRPITPTIETYDGIAKAMGITIEELFGMMDNAPVQLRGNNADCAFIDIGDLQQHRIPVIGSVAGGEPIYDEEAELYTDGPTRASCAVRLKGQSMEPLYMDGDLIYIRTQPNVDDGQIAVVILDDEACLKRVYHLTNGLQLLSENPKYKPIIATSDEYNSIRILGIPCGFTRMYS